MRYPGECRHLAQLWSLCATLPAPQGWTECPPCREDTADKGSVDMPALVSPDCFLGQSLSPRGWPGQAYEPGTHSWQSLLTPCLSGQERHSDRLVPPWYHREGTSEPEKSRDLPELTQQGAVAERHRTENLGPEADSLGSCTSPDTDSLCELGAVPPLWASAGPSVK